MQGVLRWEMTEDTSQRSRAVQMQRNGKRLCGQQRVREKEKARENEEKEDRSSKWCYIYPKAELHLISTWGWSCEYLARISTAAITAISTRTHAALKLAKQT